MKKTSTLFIIIFFFLTHLKAQTVSIFLDAGHKLGSLSIDENLLYAVGSLGWVDNGTIYIKDINSTHPHYQNFHIGGNGFTGISKVGDYVYVARTYNTPLYGIYRFNLNEENATFERFFTMPRIHGLTSRNSELYLSSEDKIYKVDVNETNPTPVQIASNINGVESRGATIGLKIYDNFLYLTETTGISRLNLDTYQKETISSYTGNSLARGNDENTFYLTGGSEPAVYELDVKTQTYSLLARIDIFYETYDIIFKDNSLFVTSGEGDYYKVVRINLNPLSTDESQQNTLAVYPNPASDFINVKGFEPNENITIINPNGQIIKSVKLENNRVNISDLKPGIYFLKSKNVYSRFIKK